MRAAECPMADAAARARGACWPTRAAGDGRFMPHFFAPLRDLASAAGGTAELVVVSLDLILRNHPPKAAVSLGMLGLRRSIACT